MSEDPKGERGRRVCMLLLHDLLSPLDPRVYKEAKALIEAGYEVSVVCWSRRNPASTDRETFEGIDVRRVVLDPGPVDASILHKYRVFKKVRASMEKVAISLRPDIVHAHDLETLPIGSRVKRRLGIPLVFDAHEDWPALEARHSRVMGILTRILQRWHIGSADRILTINEGVARRLRGARCPITILYNSRPYDKASSKVSDVTRERVGLAPGQFVLGYLGRIDRDLGYEIAIEAMKRLGDERVRLLVVGGPEEEKKHYQEMAARLGVSGSCIFTGQVPYGSVNGYLSLMDVGLTLMESNDLYDIALGNRFFDYIGAGVPLITTDLPVMRQVVERIGCGIVLKERGIEALVASIKELMDHPDARARYRENALNAFKEEFCWERQRDRLIEVYKDLGK